MFLLDVHIPESVAEILERSGHRVQRGALIFPPKTTDEFIAQYALDHDLVIITCDRGFGQITRFPPEDHPGFIILRPAKQSLVAIRHLFERFVATVAFDTCRHRTTVVEPGRVRQYPKRIPSA